MDVYSERAAVVVALAHAARALGHGAFVALDPQEPGWPVLFIELPTGQVSWHLHSDDLKAYGADLPWYSGTTPPWDGHSTAEKYRRLAKWRPES